ncbi:glycoside hydrolase superfamily, partial [Choanephora cucurbitarum]
ITTILFALSEAQASFLDKPSVLTYWGQNSKNGANTQKALSTYCDDHSDVIIVAFTLNFVDGSLPTLNLANSCTGPVFSGTELLKCLDVGKEIKKCQKKGKTILMSLGGASGAYGFSNNKDAKAFADTLWNIYGGGSSSTRPFGDAVIDGFDLDIEGGGPTGYAAMVKRLRQHFSKDKSKKYYITAAPQCPFPDAMLGKVINAVEFDAINVQFYNNYCSAASSSFNFDTWDNWAKKTSPNKKVKIMLGIPGSNSAAGSGFVSFNALQKITKNVHSSYSSFGGVSIWDASASYGNTNASPNYQGAIAGVVHKLKNKGGNTTKKSTKKFTKKSTKKSTQKSTKKSTKKTKAGRSSNKSTKKYASKSQLILCVKDGQKCSENGQYTCSGDKFGVCSQNKWVLRSCASGLTCLPSSDGVSAYCGVGTSKDTC